MGEAALGPLGSAGWEEAGEEMMGQEKILGLAGPRDTREHTES